jgi:hypothetical protein
VLVLVVEPIEHAVDRLKLGEKTRGIVYVAWHQLAERASDQITHPSTQSRALTLTPPIHPLPYVRTRAAAGWTRGVWGVWCLVFGVVLYGAVRWM